MTSMEIRLNAFFYKYFDCVPCIFHTRFVCFSLSIYIGLVFLLACLHWHWWWRWYHFDTISNTSALLYTQLTQFLWSDGITLDSLYWSKIATYMDCQISWTKRYQYIQCKKHIRRIKRTKEHCSVELFTKRVVMCCKFHSHACACVLHQFPFFCCHSQKHF